jgi:O-Antigen ligase
MSLPVAFQPSRVAPWLRTAADRERAAERRVSLAWGMLLLNTLTYFPKTWSGAPLVVPIPSFVGKGLTQGALIVALALALSVNRRPVIRPNAFLCLLSLLAVDALTSVGEDPHLGTVYRTVRMIAFIVTLWLLTPWWGRRDLLLIRAHLSAILVVLGTVLLGLIISPGTARAGGRLGGALWPTPPTQVAEFSAVTIGIVVVLWLGGEYSGRLALIIVALAGFILLETHTRTALVAMLGALLVGGMSLFAVRARVRKLFAAGSVVGSIAAITLSGFLTTWLARGENSKELSDLTGRTTVWTALLNAPRDTFQVLFGSGLSNQSFNGLPIDSNWLAVYNDEGLVGVTICAAVILFLIIAAFFQPRGIQRALALFLATYCLAASFTEVGFGEVSTYMLYVTLAASLLVGSRETARLDES